MTRTTSEVFKRVQGPVTQSVLSAVGCGILAWIVASFSSPENFTGPSVLAAFLLTSVVSAALSVGIYLAQRDKFRLRVTARSLHEINHLYRDVLSGLFSVELVSSKGTGDSGRALWIESRVLEEVCGKIVSLFNVLIQRHCVVTVKLILPRSSAEEGEFCFTWARSGAVVNRDVVPDEKFEIAETENTAFCKAKAENPDNSPSFFYSGDLLRDEELGHYKNARQGWSKFYRSAIVVPIRHQLGGGKDKRTSETLGFLSVDTMSRHRLNPEYHVEILSGFADQMSNFMCLMRRKYVVSPPTAQSPANK